MTTHSLIPTEMSINFCTPESYLTCVSVIFQLDVQYVHPHAMLHSSIGLNPTPLLDLSANIGSQTVCLGGEIGFKTASSLLTKYNAGVGFNKPDFSAALML